MSALHPGHRTQRRSTFWRAGNISSISRRTFISNVPRRKAFFKVQTKQNKKKVSNKSLFFSPMSGQSMISGQIRPQRLFAVTTAQCFQAATAASAKRRSDCRREPERTTPFDCRELCMHPRPVLTSTLLHRGPDACLTYILLTPTWRREQRNTRRHVGIEQNANGNVCVYSAAALGCYKGR